MQAIWLADSSGVVSNASEMLPAAPLVVAERNYFQTLRDRDAGTVIGQMVPGKVIKAPNFNVARRREVPDDGFDGVVIVTAFQSFFVKFWQTLKPQPDSLFALYRSDGAVLARLPPVDVEGTVSVLMGRSCRLRRMRTRARYAPYRPSTASKTVFFRHIPEFNVLVSHGIDLATVFAAWRRLVLYYAAFFALAGASLTALAVLATRGARRLRDEEAKVRTLNQDLRGHAAELEVSNQELQSLSYNISHELRAPLRAIHGFSAILLQNYAETLGAEGRRLLGVVGDAATKMGVLIDDMLDFISTGRQPIKVAEVDMAGQVQDIIAELRDGAGDRRITFEVGALPIPRQRQDDPPGLGQPSGQCRQVHFVAVAAGDKRQCQTDRRRNRLFGRRQRDRLLHAVRRQTVRNGRSPGRRRSEWLRHWPCTRQARRHPTRRPGLGGRQGR